MATDDIATSALAEERERPLVGPRFRRIAEVPSMAEIVQPALVERRQLTHERPEDDIVARDELIGASTGSGPDDIDASPAATRLAGWHPVTGLWYTHAVLGSCHLDTPFLA